MTPEQHAKAIEDAVAEYAWACADVYTRAVSDEPVARAWKTLQSAILAGVGAAPEGWQLVPLEPTPDMMCAAWDSTPAQMDDMTDGDFGQAYKNMLAAAPKP